jgi:PKD repeat protein
VVRTRLVGVIALLAVLGLATTAQAKIGVTPSGKRVGYQPVSAAPGSAASTARLRAASGAQPPHSGPCTPASTECLVYTGGAVMHSAMLTPIFWRPPTAPAFPTGYVAKIEQFFTDLAAASGATSNFLSVSTQYYDTLGAGQNWVNDDIVAGSPLIDTNSYPTSSPGSCVSPLGSSRPCVTDAGLQSELSAYITAHHLPTGLGREYVAYFPPGIDSCFDGGGIGDSANCSGTGYCGYHSYLSASGTEYINEPDNGDAAYGASCGFGWVSNDAATTTLNTTSHEISESITDPELNGWYDPGSGEENGDICAWSFVQGDAADSQRLDVSPGNTNNAINGDSYIVQAEWDNARNTCSLSADAATGAPVTLPAPSFTDSAAGVPLVTGQSLSLDAAASTAPVGRTLTAYRWDFGDGTTAGGPTATHVYTTSGSVPDTPYRVVLTVTDSAGQHNFSVHSVIVNDQPPTAAFSAPGAAAATVAAGFDASASSDLDGTIAGYSWSFGDGGTGSGQLPAHAYAAPGTYDVTLTVTDNSGATASVTHPVAVGAAPPGPTPTAAAAAPAAFPPVTGDSLSAAGPTAPSTLPVLPTVAKVLTVLPRATSHHAKKKKKKRRRVRKKKHVTRRTTSKRSTSRGRRSAGH